MKKEERRERGNITKLKSFSFLLEKLFSFLITSLLSFLKTRNNRAALKADSTCYISSHRLIYFFIEV